MLWALLAVAPLDPYRLPIGGQPEVAVSSGWTDLAQRQSVSVEDIASRTRGYEFILFGESHDRKDHKEALASLVRALLASGRNVMLGFEMFTRPNQPNLAPWSMGYWDEATFLRRTNWEQEWGFDFDLYRPVFQVAREFKLGMVALNVPRAWVRAVGRGGLSALPPEAVGQVPPIDTTNANHRAVFEALVGGHPVAGERMQSMYAAQVLWDVGMADSALKAMARQPRGRVMVMLAGSGHALYKQGIDYRITQQSGKAVYTIIATDGPRTVNGGIGDAVWAP